MTSLRALSRLIAYISSGNVGLLVSIVEQCSCYCHRLCSTSRLIRFGCTIWYDLHLRWHLVQRTLALLEDLICTAFLFQWHPRAWVRHPGLPLEGITILNLFHDSLHAIAITGILPNAICFGIAPTFFKAETGSICLFTTFVKFVLRILYVYQRQWGVYIYF